MNPVFVILVIIAGVGLWFCMNSLFPKIGEIVCGLFDETKNNIKEKEQEEKK